MRIVHAIAAGVAIASAGMLAASCAGSPGPKHTQVLPFVEDDYARALTDARAKKLPIFVDAWAPW